MSARTVAVRLCVYAALGATLAVLAACASGEETAYGESAAAPSAQVCDERPFGRIGEFNLFDCLRARVGGPSACVGDEGERASSGACAR